MSIEFTSLLAFIVIGFFVVLGLFNKEDGHMIMLFLVLLLGAIAVFLLFTKTKVDQNVYIEPIEYNDMKRQVIDLDKVLSKEFDAHHGDKFLITITKEEQ